MGIKDTTFASLFDKKDLPYLYKYAEKVRTSHDQTLVDDFNLKCQKKWDDHNPILEIDNKQIEFLQVSKADDLVVTVGINQLLDQILGVSVVRWRYMVAGTGTTAPSIGGTVLVTEIIPRVDMTLFGWTEYASSTLRYAGIFGETNPTRTITECGVFTAASGGIMLNRNMFNTLPLTHTLNGTSYVISTVIEFVPVM